MIRQTFLSAAVAAALQQTAAANAAPPDAAALRAIERRSGGRLGVYAFDTGTGRAIGHRANERFPMCSTFKLLAVGALLANVDAGADDLTRRVRITAADIIAGSPVTKTHVNDTLALGDLCAAAIEYSDNAAANLLLHALAGPAKVTAFARTLGDASTRLDRNEPTLNTAIPGDSRDTTTPFAIARTMQKLVLGTALKPASRTHLRDWLLACKTGGARLRRGVPAAWREGDKTGTGDNATMNDVALFWRTAGAPIVVAAYFTNSRAPQAVLDATLPAVGRAIAAEFR